MLKLHIDLQAKAVENFTSLMFRVFWKNLKIKQIGVIDK